jgi:hypothetical protein
MRILIFMRQSASIASFESTLRLLLERGHEVHLALDQKLLDRQGKPMTVVVTLAAQYPGFSFRCEPAPETEGWSVLARQLRLAIDYLRYLEPPYGSAPRLLRRAEKGAPRVVRFIATGPAARTRLGRKLLRNTLRHLESALPRSPRIDQFIREHRPDLVLVTPLVDLGSNQADYLRSAIALGVRTMFCSRGWDNLTSKGLMRDIPDAVTVWNDAMRHEAIELHGVPSSRIAVTGAAGFDHWFEWTPSTTRPEFCRKVGLPEDRPFLLYLCSSQLITPVEVGFVRRWIRQLKSDKDCRLRECGILVRPHPTNAAQWRAVDLSGLHQVAVWPRAGHLPVTPASRADFYDSIFHSAAVVGSNTSALIESAIVGRSVHTLLDPELRDGQHGTLHFSHLLQVSGGLLQVAATFEQHAAQLSQVIENPEIANERNRLFLEGFVRPHGLTSAATPRLVAAIEALGSTPAPKPRTQRVTPLRKLLSPLAAYAWSRHVHWERRERRRAQPGPPIPPFDQQSFSSSPRG